MEVVLSQPDAVSLDQSFIRSFRRRLLDWFRRHRRELPWRETKDPYAIWISEIMLQQTQVATVIPYYDRFLARFPTVEDLAAAETDEVLRHWAGLGYYSRARSLHAAARHIVAEHGGRFPHEEEQVLALPGVGRYTAGAIRSIAFDIPAPLLDGNVTRVLTRVLALRGDPKSAPLHKKLWRIAEELVAPKTASEFNQGMMELGALVCTPRNPDCGRCPVRRLCEANRLGLTRDLPETPARRPTVSVTLAAAAITDARGRLLIVQRQGEDLLEGFWELPTVEHQEPVERALETAVRERTGLQIRLGRRLGRVRHTITYRRLQVIVLAGQCLSSGRASRGRDWAWYTPGREEFAFSALARKTMRLWSEDSLSRESVNGER